MIKIKIDFICDKCGKKHIEKVDIVGYEDIGSALQEFDESYLPEDWSIENDDTSSFLFCKRCTKKMSDVIWIA